MYVGTTPKKRWNRSPKRSVKPGSPYLAHSAPVMKHPIAKWLRYLEDKEVAKAIVDGTYL